MGRNIIFYGAPGSGKTHHLERIEAQYIDYDIKDQRIIDLYQGYSKDWFLICLIILAAQKRLSSSEIQSKITALSLKLSSTVSSVLEKHSTNIEEGLNNEAPYIFVKTKDLKWYIDRTRLLDFLPDFETNYIRGWEKKSRFAFVTFHQSFSYEDFVEGIRPTYVSATGLLDYSPKDGVFKELCREAKDHPEKQYALFIDEINRGNIAEIFGELITLIEVDKRQGMPGEVSTLLPYSHIPFAVPNNVDIYGSMNSSDKSIAQIDIALRRRFKFVKISPSSKVIETELQMAGLDPHDIEGVDVIALFDSINKRISYLLDSDHEIGHSYFLKMRTLKAISSVLTTEIIPLLEEYFYSDLSKIQSVLNDVDANGNDKPEAIYKSSLLRPADLFAYSDESMEEDKKIFSISPAVTLESIKKIYE